MLVKVVKCRRMAWYNTHIGEVFDVDEAEIDEQGTFYVVKSYDEYDANAWYIDKRDVIQFNRKEKIQKIIGNIKKY